MQPEQLTKNAILEWLNYQPNCFVFPVYNGAVFDPKIKMFRKSGQNRMAGVSDIVGIWHAKPLAIEVKAGKNKLSPDQTVFLNRFALEGGIAIIAYSLDDVRAALRLESTNEVIKPDREARPTRNPVNHKTNVSKPIPPKPKSADVSTQ